MKRNCRAFILILPLLFLINNLFAENIKTGKIKYSLITSEFKQYEKAEWDIQLKANWTNPYLHTDITLDMLITSPSGKKYVLPCYYESGKSGSTSAWKAKYAPRETGEYSYFFRLQQKGTSPVLSSASSFSVGASKKKGYLHSNDNWTFKFDNGELFRGIGENICWEARSNDDSKYFKELHENARFNYEYLLGTLAKNGANYFRTWMCAWNLPFEWKTVINTNRYSNTNEHFNSSSFKRIEEMLSMSESLGLYVMLTLDGAVGFGGEFWEKNLYNAANGGPAKTTAEFFSSKEAKDLYKSKLRYLVARYGYYTSIGAWEFFNEIDHVMYNAKPMIEAELIAQWHDEMSTYLKSIDPYEHLVTTSISHRDIDGLNNISSIDFNQRHIYKNTDDLSRSVKSFSEKYGKPYVIGEFGFEWDWSKNFNDFAEDMDYDFKRGLWFGLFSPTPVLPMSWWWEFFDVRNMPAYFAKVRKVYDQMMQAGNGSFMQVSASSDKEAQHVYSVKCGEKYFIYVLNNGKETVTESIALKDIGNSLLTVQIYQPESDKEDKYHNYKTESSTLKIDGITLGSREDAVFIVTPQGTAAVK